jgi:hypothetical protein
MKTKVFSLGIEEKYSILVRKSDINGRTGQKNI